MAEHSFTINDVTHQVDTPAEMPLAEVLRSELGLVGTRVGCSLEQCGACRVLVDGELAWSCTMTAAEADGTEITTIEALGESHPLIRSFLALNAGQCGFCLSGIIMTAHAFLNDNPAPTRSEVAHALRENLCRCGAHNRILDAVMQAASSND